MTENVLSGDVSPDVLVTDPSIDKLIDPSPKISEI
jgi:hypothetical protein